MFGNSETFDYFECHHCGCLQIITIPSNMGRYYPNEDYYSFTKIKSIRNKLIKYLRVKRNEYLLLNEGRLGKLINNVFPHPGDSIFHILRDLELKKDYKILDVGCGNGSFLYYLSELGFENLIGIDPYIDKEINTQNLKIFKYSLEEIPAEPKFDLIIFNHSFEHLHYPLDTTLKISKLLSEEGLCIIRMPVKNDYIWSLYGTNWMQIDAPRHFHIHTIKSFKILTNQSNLQIKKTVYDSSEFQFYASEQIKRDIPLYDKRSYRLNPKKSIFTEKQIMEYKKKARKLNREKRGDQAIFFIKLVES